RRAHSGRARKRTGQGRAKRRATRVCGLSAMWKQGSVCCILRARRQCRTSMPQGRRSCAGTQHALAMGAVFREPNQTMNVAAHDALIHLMIVAASSDSAMTQRELTGITALIDRLPVFEGFDKSRLSEVANECADKLNGIDGLDRVVDAAIAALPEKLQQTAYALAVQVAAAELHLEQEELRYLEMLRDKLVLDRLVTAAIEVAARARHRRMPA